MSKLKFILPYLRPYWRSYLIGVFFIPLGTICALAIPRWTGEAVEIMRDRPGEIDPLYSLGVWILLAAAGRGLGLFATRYFVISSSRRVEYDLRQRLFDHFVGLDRTFFDRSRTGDLMSRATSDIDATRTVVGPCIMYSTSTLCLLVVAIPLMVSVSGWLTLLVLVPMTLLTVSVRIIGPRVQRAFRRAQETLGTVSSFAQENAAGIRVVKAFATEHREIGSFQELCDRNYEHNLATERISNWMHPVVGAVTHLSVILLLLVGGNLILDRQLSLGEFIEFAGYQSLLIWPMISIGWVMNQVYRGVASIGRLTEILGQTSRIETRPEAITLDPESVRGQIEIRGLTFHYGLEAGAPAVLEDVHLEIPAGKTTAIIGRTGSGKSTLAHLLTRLYPVADNAIFLDGHDINQLDLASLRRLIGVVPQDTFLFSQSIQENMAFGLPDPEEDASILEPDEAEILEFARIAGLDQDLDQFDQGLGAVIGERGVTLSGGQRQRVSIARALFYRPRILILDDALSAVDTQTEERILRNLRETTEDLTVIFISHRLSSIQDADQIYVLEEGRVTQGGRHEELVEREGLYRELYRLQALERELEDL